MSCESPPAYLCTQFELDFVELDERDEADADEVNSYTEEIKNVVRDAEQGDVPILIVCWLTVFKSRHERAWKRK